VTNTKSSDEIDRIARSFHEAYERLAPEHGYATRRESAVPWDQVPENNKKLMRAVVAEIIPAEVVALRAELAEAHETRELAIQNGAHNVDVLHQQLVYEREEKWRERDAANAMMERAEAAEAREQQLRVDRHEAWEALEDILMCEGDSFTEVAERARRGLARKWAALASGQPADSQEGA
jgi:hypothetical protein